MSQPSPPAAQKTATRLKTGIFYAEQAKDDGPKPYCISPNEVLFLPQNRTKTTDTPHPATKACTSCHHCAPNICPPLSFFSLGTTYVSYVARENHPQRAAKQRPLASRPFVCGGSLSSYLCVQDTIKLCIVAAAEGANSTPRQKKSVLNNSMRTYI